MTTHTSSRDASTALPAGIDPDWRLERDLPCPHCAYNLRMQREPRCPECGNRFRWQMLLRVTCPRCDAGLGNVVDDACPECGLGLDWAGLIHHALPASCDQFEFARWWLLFLPGLWLRALLPWTLWNKLRIESHPQAARLGLLYVINISLFALGPWTMDWIATGNGPWQRRLLSHSPVIVAALGPPLTLIALAAFGPTLARFRVRRDQLMRVVAYATCTLAWMGAVMFVSALVAWGVSATVPPRWGMAPSRLPPRSTWSLFWLGWNGLCFFQYPSGALAGAVFPILNVATIATSALTPLLWVFALESGLRRYLRLRRLDAFALTLSTQVIVGLLLLLLLTLSIRPL
ncbi:MAG: hypothetical protein KDA32_04990 [Phycisphaerales bacterium]|nr:hypothetical protein [Phycisphaerales bacterium]